MEALQSIGQFFARWLAQLETTFVDDLGADSLDVFQIIMGIEEEFDIEIDQEEAEKIVSVGDAVEEIKNALNN